MSNLTKALEYLENHIDLDLLSSVKAKTKDALSFKNDESVVFVITPELPEGFISAPIADTHNSMEKMLYNEIISLCQATRIKDDRIYSIRANYGVGTLPSLFGAKSVFADVNKMPWSEPLSKDELKRKIDNGDFSLDAGFGKRIIDTYEYYKEQLEKYPSIKRGVSLYHPDMQGPFDVAHLLYSTNIYIDMYDDPDFIHSLLTAITDTYIKLLKRIKSYINDTEDGFCYHWNTFFPGAVVLRNDTAINVSADMYNEFVRPYDQKILTEFGGGSIHYCGHKQVWLKDMILKTQGLKGINFGKVPNYEYNEEFLKEVLDISSTKNMPVISYCTENETIEQLIEKGYKKGVSYFAETENASQANEFIKRIKAL